MFEKVFSEIPLLKLVHSKRIRDVHKSNQILIMKKFSVRVFHIGVIHAFLSSSCLRSKSGDENSKRISQVVLKSISLSRPSLFSNFTLMKVFIEKLDIINLSNSLLLEFKSLSVYKVFLLIDYDFFDLELFFTSIKLINNLLLFLPITLSNVFQ